MTLLAVPGIAHQQNAAGAGHPHQLLRGLLAALADIRQRPAVADEDIEMRIRERREITDVAFHEPIDLAEQSGLLDCIARQVQLRQGQIEDCDPGAQARARY